VGEKRGGGLKNASGSSTKAGGKSMISLEKKETYPDGQGGDHEPLRKGRKRCPYFSGTGGWGGGGPMGKRGSFFCIEKGGNLAR